MGLDQDLPKHNPKLIYYHPTRLAEKGKTEELREGSPSC
uniref:Uncharacterized protein n=1 Tax=Arundo donax TaxID=35708 RepID=A0A0A9C4L8_ARUDO